MMHPIMQLKFGTYSFDSNSCDIGSRCRVVLSDSGRPLRYVNRVSVSGWLEGDGQAALSTAEDSLRAALRTPYLDLKFLSDASATMSVSLLNSPSISGVRVVDGPNFSGGDGAEYATLRRFDFEVEAEYLISGTENAVVSWSETVSITGTGGPVRRFRTPINTKPIRQQISPASVVRATQSGQAVGHTRYPTPPPPLWPQWELQEQRQSPKQNPHRVGPGLGFVNYPISWSYTFEANVPLAGSPSLPPL